MAFSFGLILEKTDRMLQTAFDEMCAYPEKFVRHYQITIGASGDAPIGPANDKLFTDWPFLGSRRLAAILHTVSFDGFSLETGGGGSSLPGPAQSEGSRRYSIAKPSDRPVSN